MSWQEVEELTSGDATPRWGVVVDGVERGGVSSRLPLDLVAALDTDIEALRLVERTALDPDPSCREVIQAAIATSAERLVAHLSEAYLGEDP